MITAIQGPLFSHKYLFGYLEKHMITSSNPIHLANFGNQGHFTWNILERIFKLTNINDLKENMLYDDPWTGNVFYFWYPEWLLASDLSFYKNYIKTIDQFWSIDGFKNFIHSNEEINSFVDIGSLARTFLGHGYTTEHMPSDGKSKLREFVVMLNNGDYIFGHGWEWIHD